MSSYESKASHPAVPRILGHYEGSSPGPLLIWLAGIHGNEGAGVLACQRVFEQLAAERSVLRGNVIGIAGNLAALAAGERFIDTDLNRLFTPDRLAAVQGGLFSCVEDHELAAILQALEEVLEIPATQVFCLDLHTTSAGVAPFGVRSGHELDCAFAAHFPAAMVLGLDRGLHGTAIGHISARGVTTLGFEGGQHDDPIAVDHHSAALWLSLEAAGCFGDVPAPHVRWARDVLHRASDGLPAVMEVRHHQHVRTKDRFEMMPGFQNFAVVRAGQVLARDRNGEITAPMAGRLLMPLYQRLGADGFFVVQTVSRAG